MSRGGGRGGEGIVDKAQAGQQGGSAAGELCHCSLAAGGGTDAVWTGPGIVRGLAAVWDGTGVGEVAAPGLGWAWQGWARLGWAGPDAWCR